jgi:hypothetical protein
LAQSEIELQRMILRGVAQGARVSDIARSLKLSRPQACQIHKATLLAKAVPVLIYFKAQQGSSPPMHHWREIVENGVHEFHQDFGGVPLTITKLGFPDAWACFLPDGKRVVGDLQTVRETAERIMNNRSLAKSGAR